MPNPAPAPSAPTPAAASRRWGMARQLIPLLLWVGLALLLRWQVMEPRWIPSGSMLPTLQLEDRILVEKLRPRLAQVLPLGAIVVFRPPDPLLAAGYDPRAALIKRVVGVPGDVIEVAAGELLRNGAVVSEPWRLEPINYEFPPLTVPPGHLLVMGDNRNASLDSHLWGPLPVDHVIGTAVFRYWPLRQLGPIRFPPMAGRG
ncbi:signal peptidase I [Synechococcus sp. Cruz-9H2]|uniref:signal peptidase I n=1 Tax=unclassified Synechococcus TaxID=2626047 RepID=UPI0037D9C30B|nr:signal peptidase I [Synechococcus sp. Cruz-9H2]MCP9842406.1 signal peptidase I [Synechococcus sp. Edmonson 11F2]MCP9854490.1 signal peptidase I [Synechococcus sp. Cruz-9C9]MCP9861814.1 signal peptidase I [Synechococcus sp. Cruz-7E5]MCP9869002.1 signal peptidase I [Synechococcus sp. Cruz-7B9]